MPRTFKGMHCILFWDSPRISISKKKHHSGESCAFFALVLLSVQLFELMAKLNKVIIIIITIIIIIRLVDL